MVDLTLDHWIAADRRVYTRKKPFIESALKGETGIIDGVIEENKEEIFYMLLFCLCVPQSKALRAEEAIGILRGMDFYRQPLIVRVLTEVLLRRVRFHAVKAKRLIEARKVFGGADFWSRLRSYYERYIISAGKPSRETLLHSTRIFLMNTINGMGMKLSSHFMRNVGMSGLAILDVHVIDGLKKRGLISIEKLGGSQSEYLVIENKMKEYACQVDISLDELDLLLWSQKTGYVFK